MPQMIKVVSRNVSGVNQFFQSITPSSSYHVERAYHNSNSAFAFVS
jgi:hypothetical protein